MKYRWIIGLALLAACGGTARTGTVAPADSPRASVNAFMEAVADSNLAKMAMLWGTTDGPAAVTGQPSDYERRVLVIHSFLRGAAHELGGDYPAGDGARRVVPVRLTRDGCTYDMPVTTVEAGSHGWLVNSFDLSVVGAPGRDCGQRGADSLPSAE